MIDSSVLASSVKNTRLLELIDMMQSCLLQISNESKKLKTPDEVKKACHLYKEITNNIVKTTIKNIVEEARKENHPEEFFKLIDKVRRNLLAMDKMIFDKVLNANPEISFLYEVAIEHTVSWITYICKWTDESKSLIN